MSKKILGYGKHKIDHQDINEVVKVLKSDSITQGKIVDEFANKVAKFCNSKYGVAVSSGSAALHLAVKSLNLKKNDEVITTPITFCATANSILYEGAKLKLVDIDENTLNIDEKLIQKNISDRTKAIIPVDFRGHPAPLGEIYEISKKKRIKIIEDASHSLGSVYNYKGKNFKCGQNIHTDLSTFSFHPVKHITTGEGGVITTNSYKLFNKLRLHAKHGIDRNVNMFNKKKRIGSWKYEMFDLGYNYRLTNFQSALGISQLKKIHFFMKRRMEIVKIYNENFKKLEFLKTPFESKNVKSNFHIYTLQVKNNKYFDRYDLFNYLKSKFYAPMVHYIPIHFLKYYKKKYKFKLGDFPVAENYYKQTISIPLFPSMTNSQIEKVIKDINDFIKLKC